MDPLVLSHLSFSYGYTQILSDVSWTLHNGDFCLLEGPTGSGKTTLLRLCHPSLAPQGIRRGTVSVCGIPWQQEGVHADAIIARMGYVSQNPEEQITTDVVWHELAFGLENDGVPQDRMRRRVAEVAHYFGIESWFHRKTSDLSLGQMQILNLASALCRQPRILLLDEPTAQLDPVSAANFAHALFRINRELSVSVVVATHEPEVLDEYATRRVHIHNTKVYEGTDPLHTSVHITPTYMHNMTKVPDDISHECHDEMSACTHTTHGKSTYTKDTHAKDADAHTASLLSFHHVWFRYAEQGRQNGKKARLRRHVYKRTQDMVDGKPFGCVLTDLDWQCFKGQIHAIVGGNGCGKSTMLLLASCAAMPSRGHVINNAKAQAYMPQEPASLFGCETVAEELHEWQHTCAYTDTDIDQICAHLHIPYHRASFITQNPQDLSGGQKQLLALAKLLLTKPDLLLLDEPFKGLDADALAYVIQALQHASDGGTTIVFSTHNMACVAALAETVSMIFDGSIASCEPVRSFFHKNMFFRPLQGACERLQIPLPWDDGVDDVVEAKSEDEKRHAKGGQCHENL